MNKIKIEQADDIANCPNPIASNIEHIDHNGIKMEIKLENNLIEPELMWLPTKLKNEQQEYYRQNDEEGGCMLATVASHPEHEEFSIEYIDEEGSDDEDISNDEIEDSNSDMDCSNYMDATNKEISENMNGSVAAGSSKETICKRTFLKWLCGVYIQHRCPVCEEKFANYELWCKHIEDQHKDVIADIKSNYHFNDTSQAICKQCNKLFKKDYSLLIHSLRHSSQDFLNLIICNLCSFRASKTIYIQSHIMVHHPHIVELFNAQDIKSKNTTYECPLCRVMFESYTQIRYHFLDSHPKEHYEKFRYECHLCPLMKYTIDNDKEFYEHLLEKHNLKDWKLMNFKQIENSDEQHFSCTKCLKIFIDLDLIKFVQHHLKHDTNSYWSCKTCNKKRSFRLHNYYHMCSKLFKRYQNSVQEKNKKEISTMSSACSSKDKKVLNNWQEFEEYVKHMCPFCNKEFDTLQKWQMHLIKIHFINTLKGLEMKPFAEDANKLQCNICNTLIINSSVQLHTHRFQHLPFKPYKCKHCFQSLNNYKIALSHVLNKCQDENEKILKGLFFTKHKNRVTAIMESYEIVCPLCKDQIFSDDEAIWQHYGVKHNNFLNYFSQPLHNSICNICQKSFAIYEQNLCVSHILKHFDQKSYKCLKCDVSFHTRNACKKHLYQHFAIPLNLQKLNNESLTSSCIQNFYSSSVNLEQNKARVGRCTEKTIIFNEFIEYISYACPECNESLATQQMWNDHINNKHDFFNVDNLSIQDPIDGTHNCKHCELKINSGLSDRQKHKLTHMPHKAFICALCNHRCNSLGVLYGHLRRIHFSKGSFKCPICSVVSTTLHERSEHLKNSHPRSEWPTSICLICYKIFAKNYQLKNHMLVHDINRPKFECEYCGSKIVERKDYNIHIGKHLKAMAATTETNKNDTATDKSLLEEVKNDDKNLLEKSAKQRQKRDANGKFCS